MIGRICAVNMLFGCNHTVLANGREFLEVMRGVFILHTLIEQNIT